VVGVTTRANCELLREALGDASGQVSFVDRDEWYVRPAHTVAGYRDTLQRSLSSGASGLRVIGEVQFGTSPEEWAEWTAYEAILNRAFADEPAWIVCPYDARVLPEVVVAGAAHTHGVDRDDPGQLVRALTPEPRPLAGLRTLPLDQESRELRSRLASELAAEGVPGDRAAELIFAANEVLSNAHRHGEGARELRVGTVDDRFVCEIADRGSGLDDPLAGYLPPGVAGHDGAGLWVVRQLTDRVELISSADGLTVRLWA
ncbi:MAG: hypothetical protein QOE60_1247, partial [Thermoleophilaceae bacterium]|nr:hypothetical protein [Thermoleophilaceae bacterium]